MTNSAFPSWRPAILLQWIPLGQNVSLGITVAYQSPTLGAWRGILVSILAVTISVGFTYKAGS